MSWITAPYFMWWNILGHYASSPYYRTSANGYALQDGHTRSDKGIMLYCDLSRLLVGHVLRKIPTGKMVNGMKVRIVDSCPTSYFNIVLYLNFFMANY